MEGNIQYFGSRAILFYRVVHLFYYIFDRVQCFIYCYLEKNRFTMNLFKISRILYSRDLTVISESQYIFTKIFLTGQGHEI